MRENVGCMSVLVSVWWVYEICARERACVHAHPSTPRHRCSPPARRRRRRPTPPSRRTRARTACPGRTRRRGPRWGQLRRPRAPPPPPPPPLLLLLHRLRRAEAPCRADGRAALTPRCGPCAAALSVRARPRSTITRMHTHNLVRTHKRRRTHTHTHTHGDSAKWRTCGTPARSCGT